MDISQLIDQPLQASNKLTTDGEVTKTNSLLTELAKSPQNYTSGKQQHSKSHSSSGISWLLNAEPTTSKSHETYNNDWARSDQDATQVTQPQQQAQAPGQNDAISFVQIAPGRQTISSFAGLGDKNSDVSTALPSRSTTKRRSKDSSQSNLNLPSNHINLSNTANNSKRSRTRQQRKPYRWHNDDQGSDVEDEITFPDHETTKPSQQPPQVQSSSSLQVVPPVSYSSHSHRPPQTSSSSTPQFPPPPSLPPTLRLRTTTSTPTTTVAPTAAPLLLSPSPPNNKHSNRRFVCTFAGCNKAFNQSNHLTAHRRLHTGEKPFVCDVPGCHRDFTQLAHLNSHRRVHTGEKPFVCDFPNCGRAFSQPTNLSAHRRTHDFRIAKPHQCQVENCGKMFSARARLRQHIMKIHGLDPKHLDISNWRLSDAQLRMMHGMQTGNSSPCQSP
eukprot:c11201_g1_i1.p1 GENE.c11201_g1_i1~~c11201_g1_i1.p1  ORF type:complete len:442 (+),score=69.00 c11201_g1_i1:486-1811(+)